jgi:hypothetical protein
VRVRYYCANCLERTDFPSAEDLAFSCPGCGAAYRARFTEAERLESRVDACAFCGRHAFFLQRDFDQRAGCAIMLGSIALAVAVGRLAGWIWFTPVLLATVVVDWILAVKIPWVTICYCCDAEYRDVVQNHRPYDPHIAERYAETKTVGRMADED